MHMRGCDPQDLLSFDPEIEATFWACRRHSRSLSKEAIEDQEAIMDPATTPLREFANLDPNFMPSSIVRPLIEAKNFQFNSGLITLFQQEQFGGSPFENPNTHISSFLDKCDTINEVSNNAIQLRLFPFSLKDKAKSWLLNSNANSSLLGRCYPRLSFASTFLRGR